MESNKVSEVVRELSKIARERQVIKASLISEELKTRLCAELDARVRAITFPDLVPPKGGKGG